MRTVPAPERGRLLFERAVALRVVPWLILSFVTLASPALSGARLTGAEASASGQTDEKSYRYRASSQAVLLNVHVSSAGANVAPLPELEVEDFVVVEDGVRQQVSFLMPPSESASSPAAVMVLVDTSSSLSGDEMDAVRRGVVDFVREAPAGNELALAAFDDRFHPISSFSDGRPALLEGVTRLAPGGGTALFDAIYEAVEVLEAAEQPRKALVVFTDGKDLDSGRGFAEVERRLEDGVTVVYVVGQYDDASRARYMTGERYYKPPELEVNLNPVWALRRIAELTGGHAMFPTAAASVAPWLTRAARDWAQVYVIGYQPPSPSSAAGISEGKRLRKLEVGLDPARFAPGDYVLRTRSSYRR